MTTTANELLGGGGVILRSSATCEDIHARGQLESQSFSTKLVGGQAHSFLGRLFDGAAARHGDVAVIAQVYSSPELRVHLSNEKRVSKTMNEWQYDQETNDGISQPPAGCNSKKAPLPAEDAPMLIRRGAMQHDLRLTLRRLGRWATRRSNRRLHFEIVVSSGRLFVVQLDYEKDYGGTDPRKTSLVYKPGDMEGALTFLQRYALGEETPFAKLNNIGDFHVDNYTPPHRLFWIRADVFESAVQTSREELIAEVERVTGGRLVVREDRNLALREQIPGKNLFRTDTVTAEQAIAQTEGRLEYWRSKSIPLQQVCFIIHGFIPARSGAWAHYDRNQQRVRIHALWGLPDGLQFLTPDEYEYDLATRELSERIHFKEFFLEEAADGKWLRQPISLNATRSRVLPASELLEIARISRLVGNKLGSDVHIMFFCGVPEAVGLGEVLPWYRERETIAYEAKRTKRLRRIAISSLQDLEKVGEIDAAGVVLLLTPEPENYRNSKFLQRVAEVANERGIPVEIQGSPLAHAYYVLRSSGCTVFTSFAADYERVRSKREFGKLVRDLVVQSIIDRGEQVVSFRLGADERSSALMGKLLEEAVELVGAENSAAKLEELSDLFEVVRSWIEIEGFELDEVVMAANEKRRRRGAFLNGDVLVGTGAKAGASLKIQSTRNYDRLTAPSGAADTLRVPIARLGLIADGVVSETALPDLGVTLKLSISDDAELILQVVTNPAAPLDPQQGDLADLWASRPA
ncbi:hypothetical protein DSM104635_03924 [Terricaulis silvestris]|uniref:Uncharacterized protein n=1 Tax=Terricaulis silvestris TaxID=2686094 RepID=A0A6I6MR03_9CAUL|nr:hypothetical protein DSM104635_03924 [Terricaulis silvestris]